MSITDGIEMTPEAMVAHLRNLGWICVAPMDQKLPPLHPAIPWIKAYRAAHRCGLKEAKDAYDAAVAAQPVI